MLKARQIAMGGILSALSFVFMFMSLFMPLTYIWIFMSGIAILIIVIEAGRKAAICAYIAVTLLCFILIPNIFRTLAFALSFGYYPIIKMWLDNISQTWLRLALKLALFLASAVVNLVIYVNLMGIEIDFGQIQQVGTFIALPIGSFVLAHIGYDIWLGAFHRYYIERLQPRIFGRRS